MLTISSLFIGIIRDQKETKENATETLYFASFIHKIAITTNIINILIKNHTIYTKHNVCEINIFIKTYHLRM